EERKRREVDPTLQILRECATELEKESGESNYARERIQSMLSFFEETTSLYDDLKRLPKFGLRQLVRVKNQVKRIF
ncbi:MAG TPA: hypothetical protein VE621_17035, partial [Bryobacteraceae bacterium]|nr:hypothetical protein [Bryobacteraceae bacterium]